MMGETQTATTENTMTARTEETAGSKALKLQKLRFRWTHTMNKLKTLAPESNWDDWRDTIVKLYDNTEGLDIEARKAYELKTVKTFQFVVGRPSEDSEVFRAQFLTATAYGTLENVIEAREGGNEKAIWK